MSLLLLLQMGATAQEKSVDALQVKLIAQGIYSTSTSKRQQAMSVAKCESRTSTPLPALPGKCDVSRPEGYGLTAEMGGGCHKLSKVLAYCLVQ